MKRITTIIIALVGCAVLAAAEPARAQLCGDADNDGGLTDIDSVNVLRSAVALPSSCTTAVCDLDGDGVVTDIDGVRSLRAAVGFANGLECPSTVRRTVTDVRIVDGEFGRYHVGGAPIPASNAQTVSNVAGPTQITAGGTAMVTLDYDLSTEGAISDTAALQLVVAIADPEVNLVDGFYTIPLTEPSGTLTLEVAYGTEPMPSFIFCPATRDHGALSQYGALPQSATQP